MRLTIYTAPGRHGELTRQAAQHLLTELGVPGEVKLTSNALDCACAGVMVTPALSIDGRLIAQGWLPDEQELRFKLCELAKLHNTSKLASETKGAHNRS